MPILEQYANIANPDQMPEKAASEKCLKCMQTEISVQKHSPETRKTRNGLIQMIGIDKSTVNKSIANDCVMPRNCKYFHSPIFSSRFIFSITPGQGN